MRFAHVEVKQRRRSCPGMVAEQRERAAGAINAPAKATVTGLALRRVLGKPHLVTEYNHPAPNTFQAEAFPFLATYGALQDFDMLLAFDYSSDRAWDAGKAKSFFAIDRNPLKMASLIPSALASARRGDRTRRDHAAGLRRRRRIGAGFGVDRNFSPHAGHRDRHRRQHRLGLVSVPANARGVSSSRGPADHASSRVGDGAVRGRRDRRHHHLAALPRQRLGVGARSRRRAERGRSATSSRHLTSGATFLLT